MQHAHRSTDLAPDERVAVERLLGRPLRNDEAIEVITHQVDELRHAQNLARRQEAAARIRELARGKKLGGVSVRQLIDEGRRF